MEGSHKWNPERQIQFTYPLHHVYGLILNLVFLN